MSTLYRLLILVALVVIPATVVAQGGPPRGTEFWLAFLDRLANESGPSDPMAIVRLDVVAGDRAADVHVEISGSGWAADVSLAAHGAGTVIVPTALAVAEGSEQIDNRAVHLTATSPVTVTAINHVPGSADATTVLPIDALGNDYRIATYDPFFLPPFYNGFAELAIVAPEAVTVEITPRAATVGGRPAGVPFTVALQSGESYQLQSESNLTGTRVRVVDGTACDRIAVFAGNVMALVDSCNSVDHLYEQMLPVRSLGMRYLVVPFAARRGGDIVEAIAHHDSTYLLGADGRPTQRLDAGERLRMRIDSAAVIEATRPIALVQYERGRACDGADAGDPSLVQLRPTAHDTLVDVVAPGALPFSEHSVTIITDAADAASVRVDGAPVRFDSVFDDAPGVVWAQVAVGPGGHTVSGGDLHSVRLRGGGQAVSYGLDLSGIAAVGPADVQIVQRCTCDGVVLEAPPGFVRYRWSTGETSRSIVARVSGEYRVTVSSPGCTLSSEATTVVIAPELAVTLEPASITVDAGAIVPFTLVATNRAGSSPCGPDAGRIALSFRATMLVPEAIAGASIVADTIVGLDRIVTLALEQDTVTFEMVAGFGDTTAAAIRLHSVGGDSCVRHPAVPLSHLTFTGCDVGGRRLFIDRDAAAIKPVRPHPVRGGGIVEFRTLERGPTRLELIDASGRRTLTLVDAELAPGDHQATLDAAAVASGAYMLVLTTPSHQVSRRLTIAR
jgi:hypothetical protein